MFSIQLKFKKIFLLLAAGMLLGATSCQKPYTGRPTAYPTAISTTTPSPTLTSTPLPPPTVTASPTPTLTPSPTPVPSATPTNSPTIIPNQMATLFPLNASDGTTVDFSSFYITQKETRDDGSVKNLSATVSFQLLDRGIHSETIQVLGQDLTVYYLRVRHSFDKTFLDVKLVLTGLFGKDIPLGGMPADGSSYISLRSQNSDMPFEPQKIHQDWTLPLEQRAPLFQTIRLTELQQLLIDLPDKVILLADSPIIFQPDAWPQLLLDMQRVSAYSARLQPFFNIDQYQQLTGQSPLADTWESYLLNNLDLPADQTGMFYAANYLVLITP